MRKSIVLAICMWICVAGFTQVDETKSLYSGGMLILQPGLAITGNEHQDIRDVSTSVGGILRMYFGKCYTAGVYGGSQKTHYKTAGSDNSYLSLGYGGPFVGFSLKSGKLRYTASAFAGMGSFRNLHIENQQGNVLSDARFYKASTIVYSPLFSLDYAITKRIYITAQTLCLMGQFENKSFYNPTLQLGILFSR
jgi:hypothetical protein